MHIVHVPNSEKLLYRKLLLLADEQWDLVERYLWRGDMWTAVEAGTTIGECVVTDEGEGVAEVRSLAVDPAWQRRGIGAALVAHVTRTYAGAYHRLRISTGDSPATVPFYESCGLTVVRRVPGYIAATYDHPIWEAGRLVTDLVVFERELPATLHDPS